MIANRDRTWVRVQELIWRAERGDGAARRLLRAMVEVVMREDGGEGRASELCPLLPAMVVVSRQ